MFYFAYGSNMNWPQMQRRCPSSRFVCAARLPGYCLAIARHSRLRDCGTANIFPQSDGDVWGIVYDVSDNDMLTMDEFEDGYERHTAAVYNADGQQNPLEVIVYIAPQETHAPLPSAEYKRVMLEGARYWKLPTDYCLMLERILAAVT
jgi:gamma-glutamylcyclotransferase